MPHVLDYSTNVYLAVSLTPTSIYSGSPIALADYPFVSEVGKVGELSDVKLLSIPKDEWNGIGEDILNALGNDKVNILRVEKQVPQQRKKRDEL